MKKNQEFIEQHISTTSISEGNNLISKGKEFDNLGSLNNLFSKYLKSQRNIENRPQLNKESFPIRKIFKKREENFEIEMYFYFGIYQTKGFYKEGKYSPNINDYKSCRLLMKENYFYILNYYNKNRNTDIFINPENTFLDKLESQNIAEKDDLKYIKYDYELSRPLLCLNFNLLTCTLLINKKNSEEFTIMILGTKKQYSFIIKDKKEKEKFCYIIGNFINFSDGYIYNKLNLIFSHPKCYYNKTYITPDYFEYIAKTGDLILFQTNHILASGQRLYTCDNYDHIAFVNNTDGLLSLYDASKKSKCRHHYWGAFMASMNYVQFKKIVYRRLNIEEKNWKKKWEIQRRIEKGTEDFIEETKDKKYYLSLCNILCRGKPKNYEMKNEWEKCEGYSCSSLVAAYYIKLGIIKLKKTIHSVLPGDFEENKKICFKPGFSLGPEKIIEFST